MKRVFDHDDQWTSVLPERGYVASGLLLIEIKAGHEPSVLQMGRPLMEDELESLVQFIFARGGA